MLLSLTSGFIFLPPFTGSAIIKVSFSQRFGVITVSGLASAANQKNLSSRLQIISKVSLCCFWSCEQPETFRGLNSGVAIVAPKVHTAAAAIGRCYLLDQVSHLQ